MDINEKIRQLKAEKKRIENEIEALKSEMIRNDDWSAALTMADNKWHIKLRTRNLDYDPEFDMIPRTYKIITGYDRQKVIDEIDNVVGDLIELKAVIFDHDARKTL